MAISQVSLASTSIKIASGQSAGLYYKTAATLCLVLEKELKKSCEVVITSGSIENLKLLEQGKVDYALVQENLIGSYQKIHRLYSEYLFILYKGKPVSSIRDVLSKHSSIDKNSGTYSIIQSVLEELKLQSFSNGSTIDLKSSFDGFCFNSSEVNLYNMGYPSDLIETTLLQCSNINIYSFSVEESSKLSNARSIKYLGKAINTVKTDVYLVSKTSSPLVYDSIKKNLSYIKAINSHID